MEQIASHKIALLITGTIVPNSNFVAHTNVQQRKQEYINGLIFYRTTFPEYDIYFLENSTYDFKTDSDFTSVFINYKITLSKFQPSLKVSEGKGYQEFEMLDEAIEQLQKKYEYFIKITGRYKVTNIKSILNNRFANMIADSHKKYKVTQTNFFLVNTKFYQTHFKNLYLKANDAEGRFIEHVIYEKLVKQDLLKKTQLFLKNPIIIGFSGSYGGSLNRNKYKMMARNIERLILNILHVKQFIIEY